MATIGLDRLYYAKITENDAGEETYGTPSQLAKAILKKHGERTEMRYEAPVLSPNMPPIPLSTAPLEIPTRCGGVVLFVLDVAQSARY